MIVVLLIIANILSDYFVLLTVLSAFHALNPCVFLPNETEAQRTKSICENGQIRYTNKQKTNYNVYSNRIYLSNFYILEAK